MKRKVSDVQLLVDDEDIEVLMTSLSPEVTGFDEMDSFKHFPFRKKDLFGVIAKKLVEFRRIMLDCHPELRRGDEVRDADNSCQKWGEDFLKKHFNFFNCLMFDLEFDKANNSLSRIALLRKRIIELKMVCEGIDLDDCIANESVRYEFCKHIQSVPDEFSTSNSKRKRK